MKQCLFLILVALFVGPALEARAGGEDVSGVWRYYKKVYQGIEMPEGPEATLRLFFEFDHDGNSLLRWYHEGDHDHCARKGIYQVKNGNIEEKVVWVDPENTHSCASDPDMQLGRETKTPYYFKGPDLAIRFHIGNEPLDMIWKKVGEKP